MLARVPPLDLTHIVNRAELEGFAVVDAINSGQSEDRTGPPLWHRLAEAARAVRRYQRLQAGGGRAADHNGADLT